ncbi:ComEC/Rec2 family competence protein [Sulfurimonas autotrophica]|uniref:ComEC/Rec2-related protein n=1 Tax=Sulfurimonas autotrophica (strain ATCC BAA-671 / DSM 16294 / JCM 11897 / OK10) TaxID=563040 RepID=E0UUF3_SULAO|nr:ComEC/Rec2 family competence protein [Sulfurimonas autotrophica]ADN08389.1 ComEC/Rec2-related protein [Sulfurimonas autotrophica DSM 16294]
MKILEKVSLFSSKKDLFLFFIFIFTLLSLSLFFEYYKYKELTKFDSQLVDAKVLKEYDKTKLTKKGKIKSYKILKLRSDDGLVFYTMASKKLKNLKNKHLHVEIWAGNISFKEYIKGFFAFSKILNICDKPTLKQKLASFIDAQHANSDIAKLYKALFLALPLPTSMQTQFSNLGISHLIAISGFHLGVLAAILFFIIKYPYKILQNRYFPYRSYKRDTFIIISLVLLGYLLFLDSPPSLLRAFVMLIVGFILYDRGIQIVSMQTLLITVLLILALFPKLVFSIGFWLSASGVFYIFLFLIHFKEYSKIKQFILLPFWVYLMMLPFSMAIFGNFSLYHPLSILWTTLFTLFYPLAIALHVIGMGNLLDTPLQHLLHVDTHAIQHILSKGYLVIEILLSLAAVFSKKALYLLLGYTLLLFIYFVYNMA